MSWRLQRVLVDDMCEHWDEPDNGLWEMRGPRRHFTHSRVMVWVALDSAIAAVEKHGLPVANVDQLARAPASRSATRSSRRGTTTERGTFVQHYDTTEVDAALLLIPVVGFLPGDDPRVLGTIAAVEKDLMRDGLLMRYRTEHDGRRGTGRRARLPRLLLLAGERLRAGRAGSRRARASWTAWSAWSTTSGCCPRSTTRRPGG